MTSQEKKIKILFISAFLLMGAIILIFISFIFYKSLQNVHKEVFNEYREVYIKNSNQEVKRAVQYFISSIKYEEQNLLANLKIKLRQRTLIGYNIVNFFYEKFHNKLQNKRIQSITLEALREADKNFAILNKNGKIIMSPFFSKGIDISKFQDAFGNKIFNIIKQDIQNSKNHESFIMCYLGESKKVEHNNTISKKLDKRIVYAKYFKPYGWYIISSVLYSSIEKKLQNDIKAKINRYRYGMHKKNYVFVLKIDITNKGIKAIRIVNPNLPKKLIGTVVPVNIKDVSGKMFFKQMLKIAFTKGEGFVSYKFKVPQTNKIREKTTFIKYYPKWHWLICSGYYPSIFYSDLKTKDAKLRKIINESVKRLIIWMVVLGAFLLVLMLFFINKIMAIITGYRRKLMKKEQFQKLLIESVPNPLFILDEKGNFMNVNRAFQEFFYCDNKDRCADRENPDIMLIKDKSMEYLNGINKDNPKEFNLADDMGRLRYIEMYNSIVYDSDSKAAGVIGVLFDVTKSRITERELMEISIKDELTGLYNRRYFNQVLPREMERAKRYGHCLSVIMYDIDHFKEVNDTFGHQVGDAVLKSISDIVSNHVRSVDFVFRIGGEEFVILLVETALKDAYEVAEKIRKMVETYDFNIDKKITISLGVTEFQKDDTFDSIIKRMDEALYRSKNNGRNKTTAI